MKSFFRICVVISTVLVLGTSHPQNYQQPGPQDHEWRNQEIPQNLPVRQWSNYRQSGPSLSPEPVNYQRVYQYPVGVDSFAPINPNEAPQNQRASHAHRIRKISMISKDLNKQEGTRVIHLPPNGNPKDLKIMLIGDNKRSVYTESDVPESVKEILARALAVNRGEARMIHSEDAVYEQPVYTESVNPQSGNVQLVNDQPMNAQSVNAQSVNAQSVNAQSVNAQSVNAQSVNAQSVNVQPVNDQSLNAQSVNGQSVNDQLINTQSVNAQPVNDKSIDTQSVNAQSVKDQSINNQSVDAQSVNDQSINTQSINAQSVNAQPVNSTFRPVARQKPRPRYRIRGSNGPPNLSIAGYPYRRRRPFQRNPNIRGPLKRPDKNLVTSYKAKAAAVANNTGAVSKPYDVMTENAKIKATVEKIITTNGKPEVISDSIDKDITIISDQDTNIIIKQADNEKSSTPAPADKYVAIYLASNPNQPASKPDIPKEFDIHNVLPDNTIQLRQAPIIPISDLNEKPMPIPKVPLQPDGVPTNLKATILTYNDNLYPNAPAKSDDAIASPKSVPTTDMTVDISPIILQTKENILTPVPTLSNDGSTPIDTKLEKTRQDDESSIVASKTTPAESLLPIHPKDNDDIPIDASTTIISTTVTEPTPISTIPNDDDSFLYATKLLQSLFTTAKEDSLIIPSTTTIKSTLLPINPNDDNDISIATNLGKILSTATDDLASTTIISSTVTDEPISNPIDNENFRFTTKLIQLLTTDNDDSVIALSTTATELTPVSTDINYNNDDKSDIISSTAPTLDSANQGISKLFQTVIKSTLAPIKPSTTDSPLNTADGSHVSIHTVPRHLPFDINDFSGEVKQNNYPYVIISRLPSEDNTTTEPSLFTTLIDYFIGNKEMNAAKTGVKDVTELKKTGGEYKVPSITDTLDKMAKANTVETHAKLKESELSGQKKPTKTKINEKETKNTTKDDKTVTEEDSEENTVITSADVASLSEKEPMTPLSFIVSLVRSALKGADSLRALFSDQRVKDFLLELFHI